MSVFHCDITIFCFIYLFLNFSIHIFRFNFCVYFFRSGFVVTGSVVLHLLMPFNLFDPFHLFYYTLFFSLRIEKILRDKIMSWRPRFVTRWNR